MNPSLLSHVLLLLQHFLGLWAIPGNMPTLPTPVACLSFGILFTTTNTILCNMAKFATAVALYRISLAIARKVIVASTFIAYDPGTTTKLSTTSSTTASSEPTAGRGSPAVPGQMPKPSTVVALWIGRCLFVWAVDLQMAYASTAIALFGVVGAWLWTSRRLVACLFAIVAEAFCFLAMVSKMSNIAALEATLTWIGHDDELADKLENIHLLKTFNNATTTHGRTVSVCERERK